jgi:hypothetical protein
MKAHVFYSRWNKIKVERRWGLDGGKCSVEVFFLVGVEVIN